MESTFEAEKKKQDKKQTRALKMMIKNHLVKGREYANQLEALLLSNNNHKPFGDGDEKVLALAQELVNKVVKSFNDSLCEVINTSSCGSTSSGDEEVKKCQDFDEVVVEHNKPEVEERRGSYKRRRADDSWVVVSETTEDGYAWRKYGQKKILNTNHPRCYYRCTHKYDQLCRAMKQVQRIDTKDSTMFQTTYISQHTCKDTTKPSQLLASLPDPYVLGPLEPKLISFQGKKQHVPPYNVNEKLKEEEETQSGDCKSSIDSSIWQDIVVASTSNSESPMEFSSETGSYHHGEVASRTGLEDLDIKTLTKFSDFSNLDFSF